MKAIAKRDCQVTLTTSLDSISLNRMDVKKGQEINLPVYKDEEIKSKRVSEILGNRSVVFQDSIVLIPTYSNDFDYSE